MRDTGTLGTRSTTCCIAPDTAVLTALLLPCIDTSTSTRSLSHLATRAIMMCPKNTSFTQRKIQSYLRRGAPRKTFELPPYPGPAYQLNVYLIDFTGNQKLRELNPGKYKELVARMTSSGQVKKVRVLGEPQCINACPRKTTETSGLTASSFGRSVPSCVSV